MALGIKIPGNGPGTGPIIPAALFSLGVNDYTHRYSGVRLSGAVGSVPTIWEDASASPAPILNATAGFQIAEASGARFLKKVAGQAGSTSGGGLAPYNLPGTVALIAYCDDLAGGTRNMVNGLGFQLGRAGNGVWQASGPGGYGSASQSNSTWEFFALAIDGTTPVVSGSPHIQRGTSANSTVSAPIATNGYGQIGLTGLSTIEYGIAELVYWPRKLSPVELTTVRTAMMANSTLF